jgi:hypothetical protein
MENARSPCGEAGVMVIPEIDLATDQWFSIKPLRKCLLVARALLSFDHYSEGLVTVQGAVAADFTSDRDPPGDVHLELLCSDFRSTYLLPFPCQWREGRYLNCITGEPLDAYVEGWRDWTERKPKQRRFPRG